MLILGILEQRKIQQTVALANAKNCGAYILKD